MTTYAGRCTYGSDERNWIKPVTASNVFKCKQQCLVTGGCVAFSYSKETKDNCILYEGGPYTHGNDRSDTTCYIMPKGKLVLIYKNIYELFKARGDFLREYI